MPQRAHNVAQFWKSANELTLQELVSSLADMGVKVFMCSFWCVPVYFIALQSGPEQAPAAAQAQAVFDQMFAANRSVKTIELSFEITENRVIARGSGHPEVKRWQGTFRAALPNRY